MKKMEIKEIIALVVFLIIIIGTFLIYGIVDLSLASRFELTALSAFQFFSTIGVTYLVSRESIKRDQEESQKKFANSSYRRIIEIYNSINLIDFYINRNLDAFDGLEQLKLSVQQLKLTVRSSAADWMEIIGKELEIVEEKSRLESQLSSTEDSSEDYKGLVEKYNKLENQFKQLPSYMKNIPPVNLKENEIGLYNKLCQQLDLAGYISFQCFSMRSDFPTVTRHPKPQERVYLDEVKYKDRSTLFILGDDFSTIGGLSNDFGLDYDIVREVLINFTHTRKLILKVKRTYFEEHSGPKMEKTLYFEVVITEENNSVN